MKRRKYFDKQMVYSKNGFSVIAYISFRALYKKEYFSCCGWSSVEDAKKEIQQEIAKRKGQQICKCGRVITPAQPQG